MVKSKWHIKWQLPRGFELFLLISAGISLIIMDYAQNLYQGHSIHDITLLGIQAISVFWIFFTLYFVLIFSAFIRAVMVRGTSYWWDWIFGSIIFLGLIGLLIGGIGAIYYLPNQAIPYFFSIKQITQYHFTGILFELLGLTYMIATD